MGKIKFLRRNTKSYSRLGRKRKKLQKWRKPKGRDNKMRLREKGYPRTVELGYKQSEDSRGKIGGKLIVKVENLAGFKKAGKDKIIILTKMGKKKKIGIAKFAKEQGIKIKNLDVNKFLEENEKKVEDKEPKINEKVSEVKNEVKKK
ncbi:MAG: eL32 family ribosomal protein [Nanoarchaeota archaeon]|nr:eL32 family ribosomal protein [Nanoarchaeota archaeon]